MKHRKYHRTFHLPWSQTVHSDDKQISDTSCFEGKEVVVTTKMDGECTSIYSDHTHARSIDSKHNFTRDWITRLFHGIKYMIPENYQVVCENMWGEHSIRYDNLDGYCYLLSIIDLDNNQVLDYDTICNFALKHDLPQPSVLYRGIYDESLIKEIHKEMDLSKDEGYVMRVTSSYSLNDVNTSIAKFVREGHVQPNAEHWLKNVKCNGLSENVRPSFMK